MKETLYFLTIGCEILYVNIKYRLLKLLFSSCISLIVFHLINHRKRCAEISHYDNKFIIFSLLFYQFSFGGGVFYYIPASLELLCSLSELKF